MPGSETPELITFHHESWDPLVARAAQLSAARRGWINLLPEVAGEDQGSARPSVFGSLFGRPGPTVPMGTWLMRTDRKPGTAGVEHGRKERTLGSLLDLGITPPAGSKRAQDHARRGLVITLPDDATPEAVLGWLMEVIDELCPMQLTGEWLAEVYTG